MRFQHCRQTNTDDDDDDDDDNNNNSNNNIKAILPHKFAQGTNAHPVDTSEKERFQILGEYSSPVPAYSKRKIANAA